MIRIILIAKTLSLVEKIKMALKIIQNGGLYGNGLAKMIMDKMKI